MKVTVTIEEHGRVYSENIMLGGLKWGMIDIIKEVVAITKHLVIQSALEGVNKKSLKDKKV